MAAGGTIFLDEVGELLHDVQVALLRVLQEGEFERVGGTQTIRADVRVIAATNRNLKQAIADGRFRSDLYYRLNVFPIEAPALRDRREDIPLLVEHYAAQFAARMHKKIQSIPRQTMDLLTSYSWPGNVRELQNVIERAVIVADDGVLNVDRSALDVGEAISPGPVAPLRDRIRQEEKSLIESVLAETAGRISGPSGAAARLRLAPSTLESKIKALNIDKFRFRSFDRKPREVRESATRGRLLHFPS